jgi:hypothetical protein
VSIPSSTPPEIEESTHARHVKRNDYTHCRSGTSDREHGRAPCSLKIAKSAQKNLLVSALFLLHPQSRIPVAEIWLLLVDWALFTPMLSILDAENSILRRGIYLKDRNLVE